MGLGNVAAKFGLGEWGTMEITRINIFISIMNIINIILTLKYYNLKEL